MNAVVIPAAGSGIRTGLKENKIFFRPDNETVIEKTVNKFLSHKDINTVVIVCADAERPRLEALFGKNAIYASGGSTRGESVLNGLLMLQGKAEKVLIHDGARPYVTEEVITRVLENITWGIGAVAGVRTTDTVKEADENGLVLSTPERSRLWNAQTPQGFMLDEIIAAYRKAGTSLTDDSAVFEAAGYKVKMVEGDYANKKITTKEDVLMPKEYFTGIGYDVHQLVEERPLVLGGVTVPHEKGLKGHSDADVLVHAVMDALLGAAGLGDIGIHFPDTDERYRGISSMLLLKHVLGLLAENGFAVVNISAVVIAQRPKLKPYIEEMRRNIASCAGLENSRVNVAATTTEHLGFTGREEGISAQATVIITK